MKHLRRFLLGLGLGVCLTIAAFFIAGNYWQARSKPFAGGVALSTALKAYERDLQHRGFVVPTEVTLDELVQKGYMRPEEIHAFDGMKVTLALAVDGEEQPGNVLARIQMQDGSTQVLLGDGSVQALPNRRALAPR